MYLLLPTVIRVYVAFWVSLHYSFKLPYCDQAVARTTCHTYPLQLGCFHIQRTHDCLQAYRLEQTVEDEAQAPPEVVCLAICHQTGILSAGYSDGTLRLWKLATRECLTVLHGHQSAVSALSFSRDASKLASGGKDTDIVVWDTLGETGLYKLKAHTDQVTGLAFLDRQLKLISTGKDGGLRVWDLASQHCCQYIADAAGKSAPNFCCGQTIGLCLSFV
jgi:WD40 repeat protein